MEWLISKVKNLNRETEDSMLKKIMKLEKNSMKDWDFKGERERNM
jgi:hypothetical protein